MRAPCFSFVIPVYGTEKHLRRCIDGVISQSYGDWEAVVVDDASPGDCKEIVDSYNDLRIRYIRHDENRSLLHARMTGVRAARGEFIIPLDSDDYVRSDLLKVLLTCIGEDNRDVIVYQMDIEEDGRLHPAWHNSSAEECECRDLLKRLFKQTVSWSLCGKVFRRSVYLEALDGLTGVDTVYINSTEDLCQFVPILLLGRRASFIEYRGYVYVRNAASLSNSWMSCGALKKCAEQNMTSISLCRRFAGRMGADADTLSSVRDLDLVTIEWLLSLADKASDALWNTNANLIAETYGFSRVLKILIKKYPNFLSRYVPSDEVVRSLKPVHKAVKRIGVVCDRGFGGGAEKATKIWAQNMVSLGLEVVWLCAPEYENEMRDMTAVHGIRTVAVVNGTGEKRFLEIESICSRLRIDTIVLVDHWKIQTLYDLVFLKSVGIRIVVAEHSSFFFPLDNQDVALFLSRGNAYRLADVVTVLSPINYSWWKASGIHNVVYMPNYLPKLNVHKKISAELHFQKRNFLFVGRISDRKGARQVLESFREFLTFDFQGKSACKLIFLGRYEDAAYRDAIYREVELLGLKEQVVFAGEVDDVQPYYDGACLVLSCSRIEGAPVTFYEAKSNGMPIIAYSLPFVDGMTESDGTVVVSQGDIRSMACAIYSCVTNKDRYCMLSQAALTSLERYSDACTTKRWKGLWQELECEEGINGGCENSVSDLSLSVVMDSFVSSTRSLLSENFSSSTSTESLLDEIKQVFGKVRRKLRDKVSEFGVIGVLKRLVRKFFVLRRFR